MGDRSEERVDLVVLLERMSQRVRPIDVVAVAAAESLSGDVSAGFQIVDDLHRRSFGDTHEQCEVADPDVGRRRDGKQHVGVVGEERP